MADANRYRDDPAYREECKARSAAYRAGNPERCKAQNSASNRVYHLKAKGWTKESYASAKLAQEGRCAICGEVPVPQLIRGVLYEPLCADHEHSDPPKPRGLLCGECNMGLGKFKDSVELLERAVVYLKKF